MTQNRIIAAICTHQCDNSPRDCATILQGGCRQSSKKHPAPVPSRESTKMFNQRRTIARFMVLLISLRSDNPGLFVHDESGPGPANVTGLQRGEMGGTASASAHSVLLGCAPNQIGGRLHLIQGLPAFLEADGSGENIVVSKSSCYFSKFFRSTVARGGSGGGGSWPGWIAGPGVVKGSGGPGPGVAAAESARRAFSPGTAAGLSSSAVWERLTCLVQPIGAGGWGRLASRRLAAGDQPGQRPRSVLFREQWLYQKVTRKSSRKAGRGLLAKFCQDAPGQRLASQTQVAIRARPAATVRGL